MRRRLGGGRSPRGSDSARPGGSACGSEKGSTRPRRARPRASIRPRGSPTRRAREAERLVEAGLLERAGRRFRLSERGLPLADLVAREFLVDAGAAALHEHAYPVG